jgi:hypothetical protein
MPDDPMVRSGDAGFYQWAAFQFPTSDLEKVGTDNEFTFGLSDHADGVMYDALRMEITNTSANPTTTGWYDYTYINGSTQVAQDDAEADTIATVVTPEPSVTGALVLGMLLLKRRPKMVFPTGGFIFLTVGRD